MEYVLNESKRTEDLPISASDLYFEVFNIFREKHNKSEVPHFDETFLDELSKFTAELLMEKKFLFGEEEMKKFSSKEVKDGAYYCYCAYVLRIVIYSGFLWVVRTNTGIFWRGLKLYGESRTYKMPLVTQKKIGGNHAFFREN